MGTKNKEGSSMSNRAWIKRDNSILNKQINNQITKNFDFSYNILEVIISTFFCCCMSKKLKKKNIINEQSNNLLYKKLDIVLFLRNTILLDIMNETLINDNNNRINIIKFLSRPVISIKEENKKEENKKDNDDSNYSENDFNKFYYESLEIIRKSEKSEMEKKLMLLSNIQLKKLLDN